MTARHTPGPWKWTEGELPHHRELQQADNMDGDSILYHGADWTMLDTDAAAIAALPELIEAVLGVTSCPTKPGKDGKVLVIADFDKLMALCDAIAKAKVVA